MTDDVACNAHRDDKQRKCDDVEVADALVREGAGKETGKRQQCDEHCQAGNAGDDIDETRIHTLYYRTANRYIMVIA